MRLALVAAPIALLVCASCGDAPGSVVGGEPLYPPPIDCSSPTAAVCGTWTHLYQCYFGPNSPSQGCAGQSGVCHATAGGSGVAASNFVCGESQASCYAGLLAASPELVSTTSKSATGLEAYVYRAGSNAGPKSNNMPTTGLNGPPVINGAWKGFTPADIQCLTDWASAGAPNN